MTEFSSFLESVDSILQQCAIYNDIQDTGFVLRIVNSLQNCITVLQQVNSQNAGNLRQNDLLSLLRMN